MGKAGRACAIAMKSPTELKRKLRRQWEDANTRESRLLDGEEAWPVILSIGKPSPTTLGNDLDTVKRHIESWRQTKIGEVRMQSVQYRAAAEPVDIPTHWVVRRPTEWIVATADETIRVEFEYLSTLVANCDSCFHNLLIRRRSLWREKPIQEVIQAAQLAMVLEPGCADGRPLRTISMVGIDTKFFERNARLVTSLLDERFDHEVSKLGLEVFLGAFIEGSHWLLLIDLDGGLLPFPKQRVSGADLAKAGIPGRRILIMENETCQHQLPRLSDTIAILGAGFDLDWTCNPVFSQKSVAYWGDIDTWGLQFLGKARSNITHLEALMMSQDIFESNRELAVIEPVVAGTGCPDGLTEIEQQLYERLLNEHRGRLEQEFLPTDVVENALRVWLKA